MSSRYVVNPAEHTRLHSGSLFQPCTNVSSVPSPPSDTSKVPSSYRQRNPDINDCPTLALAEGLRPVHRVNNFHNNTSYANPPHARYSPSVSSLTASAFLSKSSFDDINSLKSTATAVGSSAAIHTNNKVTPLRPTPAVSSSHLASAFTSSQSRNNYTPLSQSNSSYDPSMASQNSHFRPPGRTFADFDILKLIGTGGTSRVYLARDKLSLRLVALKSISKAYRSDAQLEGVANEQQVHCFICNSKNEFILPIMGSWHDNENFFIVTEYIPGCDLAVDLLKVRKLEEDAVRFYAAELVVALESLHEKKVMHRDIKPGNILIDPDGHIRLCDFGSAKAFYEPTGWREKEEPIPDFISFDVDGSCNSGSFLKPNLEPVYMAQESCGTPYFMSPEQHLGTDYSFDVDYWGLGVTMYRMLTGRMPFGNHASSRVDIKACVLKEHLVFQPVDSVSPVGRALLKQLLARRPSHRLTLEDLKDHPFFAGIDWKVVAKKGLIPPSKPFVHPIPQPRSDLPITPGRVYTRADDPYPAFRYISKELDRPLPCPSLLSDRSIMTMSKHNIFKRAGKSLHSLLQKSENMRSFMNLPRTTNPILRPLLLPCVFSDQSGSLSPPTTPVYPPLTPPRLTPTSRSTSRTPLSTLHPLLLPCISRSGSVSPPPLRLINSPVLPPCSPHLSRPKTEPLTQCASSPTRGSSYVSQAHRVSMLKTSPSLPPLPPQSPSLGTVPRLWLLREPNRVVPSIQVRRSHWSSSRSRPPEQFSWSRRLSCVREDPEAEEECEKMTSPTEKGWAGKEDNDGLDFKRQGNPYESPEALFVHLLSM